MKLIADAGSTKAAWSLLNTKSGEIIRCTTSGINPVYQDEAAILALLNQEFTLDATENAEIYYYGAGCINDAVSAKVRNALERFFKSTFISVFTDMMGAARALCGHHSGIACILGTGSNSCYYDGIKIISNVSPLGFILGDEGSGAVMGKKFMADLLKNQLPGEIKELFFSQYPLLPHDILQKVYKEPFPNRYLAQVTHFIHEHINEPTLANLVRNSFIDFFERNIKQYPEAVHLPVHFTGSIAYYFSSLLKEAAEHTGYRTGAITQSPMEGLINYHMDK
jgi:N-acetylglucosamine kinase-like BadF-type ATPase